MEARDLGLAQPHAALTRPALPEVQAVLLERNRGEIGRPRRLAEAPHVEHDCAPLQVLDLAVPLDEPIARRGNPDRSATAISRASVSSTFANGLAARHRRPVSVARLGDITQQVVHRALFGTRQPTGPSTPR